VLSGLVMILQWMQTDAARWFFIGLDGMQTYLIVGASAFVVVGLTVFAVRPTWRTMALVSAGCMALMVGISKVVRLESFNGNRTPRFVWRWEPSAEEKVQRYWISHREPARVDRAMIPSDRFAPTGRDFPGFMGPDRNAQLVGLRLAKYWQKRPPRLLWRHPVGLGWSSFAVVGKIAIHMEQRGDQECIVCYDLRSGEELWAHGELARFRNEHGDGPRSTPLIHADRVYACGATGWVTCIDVSSGELVWKRNLFEGSETKEPYFGWTCSPLISAGALIVTPGIAEGGSMMALDLETGKERWRAGKDPTSYASPIAATLCGDLQYLSFNGEGLRSFASNGEDLWFHPWLTQGDSRVNVAQPVVVRRGDSHTGEKAQVLISSGYEMGTTLLNISHQSGRWEVEPAWTSKHLKSKLSNFVLYREHIYGLDNGLLTCLRLSDGERTWKKGRYGHGQMLLVDGNLMIQCESGEIALVEATPEEYRELARFEALSDKTWNHPTLAGNVLLVRNDHEAAAYELPMVLTRE
jgi:outer membrane protein assembly factor BamB